MSLLAMVATASYDSPAFEIDSLLAKELGPKGFEAYPFLIGWYNENVIDKFKLKYPEDNLAFVIISTPDMFEKVTMPFIESNLGDSTLDPVDSCVKHEMQTLRSKFNSEMEIFYDFEMDHNRRPRILVQTAGHVAGAAYFYQRSDVREQPWDEARKIFGVSVHAEYGGWFALRCVLVFKYIKSPKLPRKEPLDVVIGDEKRIELLNKFNDSWQDWQFRDIIPVKQRYSEKQKEYFSTLPKDRKKLLQKWKNEEK